MNVSIFLQMAYENKIDWTLSQNKPNSNPNKPNLKRAKMNANVFITKDYRKKDDFIVRINKPNFRNAQNERKLNFNKGLQKKRLFSTTKNKPNSNPISEKAKMNVNVFITKVNENETTFRLQKNKPNTNPVLSAVEWANFKPPGKEPKKLKRKRGPQELFYVSGLTERLTFWMDMICY